MTLPVMTLSLTMYFPLDWGGTTGSNEASSMPCFKSSMGMSMDITTAELFFPLFVITTGIGDRQILRLCKIVCKW